MLRRKSSVALRARAPVPFCVTETAPVSPLLPTPCTTVYPEIFKLLKTASTSSSNYSLHTMVSIFTSILLVIEALFCFLAAHEVTAYRPQLQLSNSGVATQ